MNVQEAMLDRIRYYIANGNICGAYLKVRQGDTLIVDGGTGVIRDGSDATVTENTMFRLASMTKPIMAAAAMTFVEDGTIRLSDKVAEYIPAYAEKHADVEILHLLNHSNGLGMTGMPGMFESFKAVDYNDRLADRVEKWAQMNADFPAGTATGYSACVGFDILSRILEIAAGKELDEILRERIFDPLGMKDTTFVLSAEQKTRAAEVFKDRNIEHTPEFEAMNELLVKSVDAEMNGYFAGCAGLWGSAADYDRLARMYRNLGELDGVRILKPETVKQMSAPTNDLEAKPDVRWGIGMQVFGDPKLSGVWVHPGAYGWSGAMGTHFFVDPAADRTFVMVLNADGLNGSESFISRDMEKILYDAE